MIFHNKILHGSKVRLGYRGQLEMKATTRVTTQSRQSAAVGRGMAAIKLTMAPLSERV